MGVDSRASACGNDEGWRTWKGEVGGGGNRQGQSQIACALSRNARRSAWVPGAAGFKPLEAIVWRGTAHGLQQRALVGGASHIFPN